MASRLYKSNVKVKATHGLLLDVLMVLFVVARIRNFKAIDDILEDINVSLYRLQDEDEVKSSPSPHKYLAL